MFQQCASKQNDSNQNLHTNEVYGTPLVWSIRATEPALGRLEEIMMLPLANQAAAIGLLYVMPLLHLYLAFVTIWI